MPPSADKLSTLLTQSGATPELVQRVVAFFQTVQRENDEMVRLGHAYFINCIDEGSARRAWNYRLLPFFRKASRLDAGMLERITKAWARGFPAIVPQVAGQEPIAADAAPPLGEGDGTDQAPQAGTS